jgi:RNA polymerase sigma factor (sigma-70 family)
VARHASLVRLCVARGCSPEDAKELVQESYVRLFEYQRSVQVRNVNSLLRRIVINLSITYYHRELSRNFVFEPVDRLERQGIVIDSTPDPERTLAAEQELDTVANLMSAMTSRTRQIFIAHCSGYTYKEIAAAFVIKPRTVEKHVTHATSTLIDLLLAHIRRTFDLQDIQDAHLLELIGTAPQLFHGFSPGARLGRVRPHLRQPPSLSQ